MTGSALCYYYLIFVLGCGIQSVVATAAASSMTPLSIPRPNNDWAPRKRIQAAYYYTAPPTSSSSSSSSSNTASSQIQEARFFINSSIPAVNLDNFPHISSVECMQDNSTLRLNFTDLESAQRAFQEWFQERQSYNLSLYVNHHHNCFGKSHIQALYVKSMSLDEKVLLVNTHALNHSKVFGNYEVYIGDASPLQTAIIQESKSRKNKVLEKRDKQVSKHYEFSVNYQNNSVYNSNFTLVNFTQNVILQFPRISAYCIDCFSRGNASFDLYMRTESSKVVDYKLRTKGHFEASSDFDFHFPKSSDKRLISFGAFYFNLGPNIYIPGLFYLGLSASFGGSFTYAANQKFKMQFGFETRESFDIVIEPNRESKDFSLAHIFHVPKVTRLDTGVPAAKHHPFVISNTTDLIYSLHFGPMLDLTLTALEIDVVSFKLSFDTGIGLETLTGSAKYCTNVAREYEMQRRHAFNFDIKLIGWSFSLWRMGFSWAGFSLARKHFEIWATKYLPLTSCDFCASPEKCPAGFLNLNRTVPKKIGLDNFS